MSVVVVTNRVIASDSRLLIRVPGGSDFFASMKKIFTNKERTIAIGCTGTGCSEDDLKTTFALLKEKLKAHEKSAASLVLTDEEFNLLTDDDNRHLIILTRRDAYIINAGRQSKKAIVVSDRNIPYAIGTGCNFALIAMQKGMTAPDAVTFTKRFNYTCAGEIQMVSATTLKSLNPRKEVADVRDTQE
jgi:hypothetical protein